jgi:hypothetical protein
MQRPTSLKLSQNDTTVNIAVEVAKGTTLRASDVEIEIEECDLIFQAHPYFFKLRFNEHLVEGGPNFRLDVTDDSYLISVGKLNYKQQFTQLDQPEILLQDIDEELREELNYEEETKSEVTYSYGLKGELKRQIPTELTSLSGCCDPLRTNPEERLMLKL